MVLLSYESCIKTLIENFLITKLSLERRSQWQFHVPIGGVLIIFSQVLMFGNQTTNLILVTLLAIT